MTLSVGDTWADPGATALDDRDGDLTGAIVVSGTVDTATAGTYTLDYDVADAAGNDAATVSRTVTVEPAVVPDTTPPVITLTGAATVTLSVGDSWTDPGAAATDDRDGDLTGAIVVSGTVDTATAGTYTVDYDVADAAGNAATTATRTVTVSPAVIPDTTKPVITLTGAATITLTVGDTWTDPGATATDDRDGDLTSAIVVTGTVDTATAGTYPLTYDVTDAAGNAAATVTRTITVEAIVIQPGALTAEVAAAIVNALYADLLGYSPDSAHLAVWTRALLHGVSETEVATRIMRSEEYFTRRIRLAYQDILARTADTRGARWWFTTARAGLIGLDDVQRAFPLRSQYPSLAAGTPEGLVAALHATVLHRTAEPAEILAWIRVYEASGRTAVLNGIWYSPEAREVRGTSPDQVRLGRPGDASPTAWVGIGRSRGEERARMGLLGPTGYRDRSLVRYV